MDVVRFSSGYLASTLTDRVTNARIGAGIVEGLNHGLELIARQPYSVRSQVACEIVQFHNLDTLRGQRFHARIPLRKFFSETAS